MFLVSNKEIKCIPFLWSETDIFDGRPGHAVFRDGEGVVGKRLPRRPEKGTRNNESHMCKFPKHTQQT